MRRGPRGGTALGASQTSVRRRLRRCAAVRTARTSVRHGPPCGTGLAAMRPSLKLAPQCGAALHAARSAAARPSVQLALIAARPSRRQGPLCGAARNAAWTSVRCWPLCGTYLAASLQALGAARHSVRHGAALAPARHGCRRGDDFGGEALARRWWRRWALSAAQSSDAALARRWPWCGMFLPERWPRRGTDSGATLASAQHTTRRRPCRDSDLGAAPTSVQRPRCGACPNVKRTSAQRQSWWRDLRAAVVAALDLGATPTIRAARLSRTPALAQH